MVEILYNILGYARYSHVVSASVHEMTERLAQLSEQDGYFKNPNLVATFNHNANTFTLKQKRSLTGWRSAELRANAIIEGALYEVSPTQTEVKYLLRPNPGFFSLLIVFTPVAILSIIYHLAKWSFPGFSGTMFILLPLFLCYAARNYTQKLRRLFLIFLN